jgi:hypothetical protein
MVTSLQREVEGLKNRLVEVGSILNQLNKLVTSLPSVPESVKRRSQSLQQNLWRHQLPSETNTIEDKASRKKNASSNSHAVAMFPPDSDATLDGWSQGVQPWFHLPQSHSHINQASQAPNQFHTILAPQVLSSSPDYHTSYTIESPLAFSLRLRQEALKGAYDLVSTPTTPLSTPLQNIPVLHLLIHSRQDKTAPRLLAL